MADDDHAIRRLLTPEAAVRTNIVGLHEKPVDLKGFRTRVRDALRNGNP